MSNYTNYDSICKLYDRSRRPVGLHAYVGSFISILGKPLKDMHLLDLGCGTGTYSKAMLDLGVGKVSLLDGSPGMLAVAKEKVSSYGDRVQEAVESILPNIPFPDGQFDCVMVNQVLHHLTDLSAGKNKFSAIQQTFKELRRVVKKGGVFIINHSTPIQVLESFWYSRLLPEANARLSLRNATISEFQLWLKESGFEFVESYAPLQGVLLKEMYFDAVGPLRKEFRDGDSFWSNLTAEELETAIQMVEKYKEAGRAEDEMMRLDVSRTSYGQCSVVVSVAV